MIWALINVWYTMSSSTRSTYDIQDVLVGLVGQIDGVFKSRFKVALTMGNYNNCV